MKTMKTLFASIAAISVLAGCGGGGDGGSTEIAPGPSATAEGFWSGTTSTGTQVNVAILETGETWGVYTSGNSIIGALYGNTTSSGTSLNGSGSDFNIPSRTVTPGTYSGTYSSRATISLTASNGTRFSGTYSASYDQAASLAAVAGTFSGTGVSGGSSVQSASVTISSSGAVSTPVSNGCSSAGTFTPRPSGKNIFNVSVTFTGANCALGNGATTTGVAYYDSATRQLLVMALNSARSDGFIYIGSKPAPV
ncbi:MAG: hypothetical protein MUF44_06790 [Hydrogenophaga sp.]|jgi:hypothetical protein|nr:hypothetical protein [Hydrogenophaga sp.]